MPAPTEPRSVTDAQVENATAEATATAAQSPSVSDVSVVSGFGPPAAAGEVGALGPYRVVKELGKGGMGAVYAAVDTRLDRRLALKVMLPEFASDADAKSRFLREARAAARIKHDNVVTVYEADERNGVPYIAMEFLDGLPLDAYLKKKGGPAIPQIIRIVAEAASGLKAAHDIGLVHRDIKPANLWLEAPHGRVKVLDFGLAKPLDAESEVTKSGAVVGTPAYMSPEQARGDKVDARTDLFSLGSVLYRLCSGKLPFSGPTTMAVLMSLGMDEPPPVREVNPDVPESLAALIAQLLSKRADARPQSAAEVVTRLRAIARELAASRPADLSASLPQVVQPSVAYAPIAVTAVPPEASPFADLDSPDADQTELESAAEPAPPKPFGKKPGPRWLWPAVGLAAVLVLVGGVVAALTNKGGGETKGEPPDGPTAAAKDKGGKPSAQGPPGTKGQPTAIDPNRELAAWVVANGGEVMVNDTFVVRFGTLPDGDLRLTEIRLYSLRQIAEKDLNAGLAPAARCRHLRTVALCNLNSSDATLAPFRGITGLTRLTLDGPFTADGLANFAGCNDLEVLDLTTGATDAGLAHFKDCKKLKLLQLIGGTSTSAGLAHFAGCADLETLLLRGWRAFDPASLAAFKGCAKLAKLDLHDTSVTDAGLVHLKELKGLAHVMLAGTKVTAKGLEALAAALPACKIEHDGRFIDPEK